jgi:hypothetical protein
MPHTLQLNNKLRNIYFIKNVAEEVLLKYFQACHEKYPRQRKKVFFALTY